MFADVHSHPHSRSYAWRSVLRKKKERDQYHPWKIVLSNDYSEEKGQRATNYGQADLAKIKNGNVRLVFAALYPIERGFFDGTPEITKETVVEVYEKVEDEKNRSLIMKLLSGIFKTLVPELLKGGSAARHVFQMLFMDIPGRRVKEIITSKYKYYDALLDEYNFLISRSGVESEAELFIPYDRFNNEVIELHKKANRDALVAKGKYVVVKDAQELKTTLDNGDIAMVLTIEGAHALGSDQDDVNILLNRVKAIKAWGHPVLFITFSHHFYNFLCGHAHSFPRASEIVLDQKKGMNSGFVEDGWKVIRAMLSLREDNTSDPSLGRRILIDVKHMSSKGREEFYNKIIRPCLQKDIVIPVVASHCGYTGVKSLNDLNRNSPDEDDDTIIDQKFYGWNINLCQEDVEIILLTDGLIGLSFDQRILGVHGKKGMNGNRDINSITCIWNNLKSMLDAIVDSDNIPFEKKKNMWNIFSIGTDFDGYIDPVDDYSTALRLSFFQRDMIIKITQELFTNAGLLPLKGPGGNVAMVPAHERYFLSDQAAVPKVAHKLCFENAMNFAMKHLT